jgi:O-antigen ligase
LNIDPGWHGRNRTADPAQLAVALVVLVFPSLVLVTALGTGLVNLVFLLAALAIWRGARAEFLHDLPAVRWVVLAMLINFLFALVCFALRPAESTSVLEKPLRMLSALSAMLVVRAYRPSSSALWHGLVAGALSGVVLVGYQRWGLHIERPGGLINAITFGDLSLCLGLMALAWAGTLEHGRQAVLAALGALAALVGTVATGTRGGWIALPFAAIIFFRYRRLVRARLILALGALTFGLLVLSYVVPQTGMRGRIADAVANVDDYFKGGNAYTQVGIRLELWKGAALLIGERPWFGQDIDSYKRRLATLVAEGRLDPVALGPSHIHNDALQTLVTGGVPGFLVWSATLFAPLMFFAAPLRRGAHPSREQVALALSGMLLVACYFSFGLTEVIFWTVRSTVFFAMMVFILMGFCLNAGDTARRQAGLHD